MTQEKMVTVTLPCGCQIVQRQWESLPAVCPKCGRVFVQVRIIPPPPRIRL
ncbi:MAG: hypothetical protein V1846_03150 [Candidatus Komeilibacteria bacterium]